MRLFNTENLSDRDFEEILSFLERGGVIAYPTDTAYGLGADALRDAAVRDIFRIKGRAEEKPILVVVDSMKMLGQVAHASDDVLRVTARFWPGALTVVLPAVSHVPAALTAGTGTVGVRWPNAPFALRLLQGLGRPLTATSANRSGRPAAITADEVRAQLEDSLEILVDGGQLPARGGSTVLDMTSRPAALLREGPVSFEALKEVIEVVRRYNY
jgi:L-threonylcarbamoyladenylate synthase